MSQLPLDSSFEPQADSGQDLPDRLVKHAVKYTDHRSVARDALTPMMRHYADTKDQYPHALLFYRVGDFFETFFQDAVTIARELELVLTSKDGGKTIGRVPLAGIPHHSVDRRDSFQGYAVVGYPRSSESLTCSEASRFLLETGH